MGDTKMLERNLEKIVDTIVYGTKRKFLGKDKCKATYKETPHFNKEGEVIGTSFTLICPVCGIEVKRNYNYCPNCDTKIK